LEAASLSLLTISNFSLRIDPFAKANTDPGVFQGGANPFDFNQVDANTDNHGFST
jgi:hypothetical protein